MKQRLGVSLGPGIVKTVGKVVKQFGHSSYFRPLPSVLKSKMAALVEVLQKNNYKELNKVQQGKMKSSFCDLFLVMFGRRTTSYYDCFGDVRPRDNFLL